MARFICCLLFLWPLLNTQMSHGAETCREIVEQKGTTIRHKKTIIDGGGFSSHFHLSQNPAAEKPASVYVEFRIYYLSQGKEVFVDGSFITLVEGEGHDVDVWLPYRPGHVPEKVLGVDIRKAQCAQ